MEPRFTHDTAVTEWLKIFGLDQYSNEFQENGYEDIDCLRNICSEDLEDIGVQLAGHRKKLLYHISKLGVLSYDSKQEKHYFNSEKWQPDFENFTQHKNGSFRVECDSNSQNNHRTFSNCSPMHCNSVSHQVEEQTEVGANGIMEKPEELHLELGDEIHQNFKLRNTIQTPFSNPDGRHISITVFGPDMVSKMSIDIEENTQSWYVTHQLIMHQEFKDSPNWGLIEVISQFSLQRMLEDHEVMSRADVNRLTQKDSILVLKYEPYKYDLFQRSYEYFPAQLCLPDQQTDDSLDGRVESARKLLIDGYLSSVNSVPELKGILYLKYGKKSWKRKFVKLRASGLYFSKTVKCRQEKYLSLLCCVDSYDVYIAANYKKVVKAPYECCFVLKSRSLKLKLGWDDLICFSAPSKRVMFSWIAGIRIAKEGGAVLRDNFITMSDKTSKLVVMKKVREVKNTALCSSDTHSTEFTSRYPLHNTAGDLLEPDHFISSTNFIHTSQMKIFLPPPHSLFNPANISPVEHLVTQVADHDFVRVQLEYNRFKFRKNPTTNSWFHGSITKDESARRIAYLGGVDGTFLFRESISNKGSYVLTMIFQKKLYHYIIQNHESLQTTLFSLDNGPRFPKLQDLYQYYTRNSGGLHCKLTQLCVNTSLEAVVYSLI